MISFSTHRHLQSRIESALQGSRALTFFLGSGLTASYRGVPGVPSTSEMVALMCDALVSAGHGDAVDDVQSRSSASLRYQEATQHFVACLGQNALNDLVRDCVLKARKEPLRQGATPFDGWHLSPGVAALGALLSDLSKSSHVQVLTTNFDPLIEAGVSAAGGQPVSISLDSDGRFDNVVSPGSTNVVHLHGYWDRRDTLHTPQQLGQARPQLAGCLRGALRDTTLLVLGYGGWWDSFTSVLAEMLSESTDSLDVLWAFLSSDEIALEREHSGLIRRLESRGTSRVALFKGIDCHLFLPSLQKTWASSKAPVQAQPSEARIEKDSYLRDYPPSTTAWVGREDELATLSRRDARVVAITGIGGQGKSTLAARFFDSETQAGATFSDWRDCREQANTLNTQLAKIVARLCERSGTPPPANSESTLYLIDFIFAELGQQRAVFVFDNADQYVDLANARLVGGLDLLLDRALRAQHNAKFILTCRPKVELALDGSLQIELGGLTGDEEALDLFYQRGVTSAHSDRETRARILRVRDLTNGHPLWMNLIATQVSQDSSRFDSLLRQIDLEQNATLPRGLLREIWKGLSAKQQKVLRYMAEIVYPETEDTISQYIGRDMPFKQLRQTIRSLRGLELVVLKTSADGDALELHPLVRQFIHQEFAPSDRHRYASPIIKALDAILETLGLASERVLTVRQLRYPTSRIELAINTGDYENAAELLLTTAQRLFGLGHVEEFVRLAEPILANTTWADEPGKHQTLYDRLIDPLVDRLSDLGRFEDADRYMDQFEASISGKTSRFIGLCNLRCFSHWSRKDFGLAVQWGQRGQDLKAAGGVDTHHDCAHNLALAQRDSGDVTPALQFFLRGLPLDDVVAGRVPEKTSGPFWGNIARCLHLQGKRQEALACLLRSAAVLEKAVGSSSAEHVNRGWAAFWLAELLEQVGELQSALTCYLAAFERWRKCAPPRALLARAGADRLIGLNLSPPPSPEVELRYERILRGDGRAIMPKAN